MNSMKEGAITEIVNAPEPLSVNRVEQMMAARYHMPPQTLGALKTTAALVVAKLAEFIDSTAFDNLPVSDKLKVFDSVMNRAHGLPEAPTAAMATMAAIAEANAPLSLADPSSLGAQLEAIESRRPFPERANASKELNTKRRRDHLKDVTVASHDATKEDK